MVGSVCLSTAASTTTYKVFREIHDEATTRNHKRVAAGEGRWHSSTRSEDRRGGTAWKKSSKAAATLFASVNGSRGPNHVQLGRDVVVRSSRILWMGHYNCVLSQRGRGPRSSGATEAGLSRRRIAAGPGFFSGAKCPADDEEVLRWKRRRRRRRSRHPAGCASAGPPSPSHPRRCWKVQAVEDDDDEDDDLLGTDDGYWDGTEGREQLNEIEEMKELIAEAENLRRAAESAAERGPGELTSEEIEKQRAEKLREELARRAKAQAEQRKQAEIMFGMGQRAYGRGVYDKSVQLLEAALSNVPTSSNLGGDIQIWLAMAYEANNRHGDCIALYKRIEDTHPNKKMRRQAADLRYILEAPKLKISREEMVSIPIIERDYDRGKKTWSQTIRDRKSKPMPKQPKTKDYLEDWLVWDPPRWERSPYFWVAVTVWLTLIGVSLMFQD